MVILYLTCGDETEAKKISTALLEAKLAACIRTSPVNSRYWWKGKMNNDEEQLLMIETIEEKFDAINGIIGKLQSYDEYVLTMVPVIKTTPGVEKWLTEVIK